MATSDSPHGPFAIPSLDGFRAVAVMIVFIGHGLTLGGPWPGHVGVTIFFFLSGYLITTLLRREIGRTSRLSLGKFYLRRALRITPPALLAILITTAVGVWGLLPSSISFWGVLAETLNYTNFYMIAVDGHEGLPPASSMLWSLAVEEHFYLIWPAVLIVLLWRRVTLRGAGYILLGFAVLAPFWRLFLYLNGASFYRLYVSTDTRVDGLLAGAAIALLCNPALGDRPPFGISVKVIERWLAPAAILTLVALALSPYVLKNTFADTGIYACLVLIFWSAIASPFGWMGRILNHKWIAKLGILSFSIYLFHRLFLDLYSTVLTMPIVIDGLALISVVVFAQLVYLCVERPLGTVRKRLESNIR